MRGLLCGSDDFEGVSGSESRKELQSVFNGKGFRLPRLFSRGKCVGGTDEIKQLREVRELGKLLDGFGMDNHFGPGRGGDHSQEPTRLS